MQSIQINSRTHYENYITGKIKLTIKKKVLVVKYRVIKTILYLAVLIIK